MQTRLSTEERQAEIVDAALRLARELSPALITTSDIAAAVGITQGAVFKHFPTKEAIWHAAMSQVQRQLLAALGDAAEAAATPLDALAAVFKAHVRFVLAHPGVPRCIFHELQQPTDSAVKQEVRGLLQRYRQLLMRLLDAAIAVHQLPATLDRESAATLFVGIVQGLVMQSMLAGRSNGMKAQADRVFAIYLRGVGAAP
ncbi:MAG TPA: TetR/AcrR family transcriptional regulator [Albitalea sp.]